ncbi:uncharacterized protein LOC129603381 [Betta splendens]|uniref:Uncharacterized protein LOC129603381 n=1 Tax=Betta splendens TaxID=158456 RepID=A0A9W2XF37_BETSP|nr:uncharacterized protein LOC129603381 [Betta splendens]
MYTRLIITVLIVAGVAVNTATAQSIRMVAQSNSTTNSNPTSTTQASTTQALNTVGAFTTSVFNSGCGAQQLCLSQPSSCDPSTGGSCDFIYSQQLSGQNYQLGLSGSSAGYIAVVLSTAGSVGNNDTTYICANNNSVVQSFVAYLIGNVLHMTPLGMNSMNGSVKGNRIQCIFNAMLPTRCPRALNLQVGFLTGSYNATNGTLGFPTVIFQKSANLSNAASHAITFKQSLTEAVLIVMVAQRLTMS